MPTYVDYNCIRYDLDNVDDRIKLYKMGYFRKDSDSTGESLLDRLEAEAKRHEELTIERYKNGYRSGRYSVGRR